MEAESRCNDCTAAAPSLLRNLQFGFGVWLTEIRSLLASAGRSFEIRQLQKRLEQESAKLGNATAEHLAATAEEPAAPSFEMVRTARQIQFLKDEIMRLRTEHDNAVNKARAPRNSTYCA